MYSVYKVENLINRKCYIGSCYTRQLRDNKRRHFNSRGSSRITKDLERYSRSDFDFSVLHTGIKTKGLAESVEQRYIDVYDAYYGGYNCTKDGRRGYTKYARGKSLEVQRQTRDSASEDARQMYKHGVDIIEIAEVLGKKYKRNGKSYSIPTIRSYLNC